MKWSNFATIGAVVLLGGIVGCGGSSGGASTNATPPTDLTYSTNPATYTKGVAIAPNTPSSGGGAVVSYSVSPSSALPADLSLNTSTGVISGTPTTVMASASYTVTATNTGGSTTASLSITVNDAAQPSTWYQDADGDGYGNPATSLAASDKPDGYVSDATDCNDSSSSVHPGATEICTDGTDNDCNGLMDECPGLIAFYPFNGDASDRSGNGNDGTLHGPVPTQDRRGSPSQAYELDGIDDYIDLGSDPSLRPNLPVTIAAWVDRRTASVGTLFANDFTLDQDKYYGVGVGIGESTLNCQYGDGEHTQPSSRRSKIGTTALNINTWYHIAVVLRGPLDMDLYVNGVYDGGIYDGTGGALAYYGGPGVIGVYDSSGFYPPYYFAGAIDELRVYSRALPASEIEEVYNNER